MHVPDAVRRGTPEEQIAWLARLPDGVRISTVLVAGDDRRRWVVEAADHGAWGNVLSEALYHLLNELAGERRVSA